jgi:hypothetical protein
VIALLGMRAAFSQSEGALPDSNTILNPAESLFCAIALFRLQSLARLSPCAEVKQDHMMEKPNIGF